ncbi:glutamine synthetase [Sodiomyces alkalinus F11]|uniref:Glutamine synthetase n=1 Tax=Sodiomyces alkalinus (strain CBS 110278 / VKM F-3762 / F11) TaxID=1314773 RepID=A0A3N2Q3A4_SODAK|nr:glutamine synthetase [Sodiomyces alkalinus F11]ROT41230.1 glutamine synthetase [Sodiomyces alkalinus F11]
MSSSTKLTGQALLSHTIQTTPIIDHHAHPILQPDSVPRYPLLSITTEANGDAIHASLTSLSHLRAVKQLAKVLQCAPTWESVVNAIEQRRLHDYDQWVRQCLAGIETILVDDGLVPSDDEYELYPYDYFDGLVPTPATRVLRLEKIAADIINAHCPEQVSGRKTTEDVAKAFDEVIEEFDMTILRAISKPEIVAFKSVICYRTGLAISRKPDAAAARADFDNIYRTHTQGTDKEFTRLEHRGLNEFLVHRLASIIQNAEGLHKKPIQFHTGLGDNDITLSKASPAHLQDFIREYPTVPIVLLHASYPYTREAGYLASVYANVYADIGEIFPCLSQDGQETALRQILELCPWSKILWSTDGHYFPETYLLAVLQIREALGKVLGEYARKHHITWHEASELVRRVLFLNANHLYSLGLPLRSLDDSGNHLHLRNTTGASDLETLEAFLEGKPEPYFLRIYWNDLTAMPRLRAIPLQRVLSDLREDDNFSVGITKASLGLLQNDVIIPGVAATGEYRLHPDFSSLVVGPSPRHVTTFGDFREQDGSHVPLCPRSLLQRLLDLASRQRLTFQVGFEIELVLFQRVREDVTAQQTYAVIDNDGHAWSVSRMMDHPLVEQVIEPAIAALADQGILVEQFHPESAPGQFEIVLPSYPPLQAVDTLIHARNVISGFANQAGVRMSLHPKPFATTCGNASHAHISITSPGGDRPETYEPFYAGILRHLPAVCAFTYSNPASYDRLRDSTWAGGRWVAWGTQNRETPLRKVEGSHWEVKCIDGLANPYLALSAVLGAGLLGVQDEERLVWGDCEVDPATLTDNDRAELNVERLLPPSLEVALGELGRDEELAALLGEELVERYAAIKEAEISFLATLSAEDRRQWILARY